MENFGLLFTFPNREYIILKQMNCNMSLDIEYEAHIQ